MEDDTIKAGDVVKYVCKGNKTLLGLTFRVKTIKAGRRVCVLDIAHLGLLYSNGRPITTLSVYTNSLELLSPSPACAPKVGPMNKGTMGHWYRKDCDTLTKLVLHKPSQTSYKYDASNWDKAAIAYGQEQLAKSLTKIPSQAVHQANELPEQEEKEVVLPEFPSRALMAYNNFKVKL